MKIGYIITLLYFELQEKNIDLEKLKNNTVDNVTSVANQNAEKPHLINLHDDKGNLKLSVSIDNLFFFIVTSRLTPC